jgi:hypothetical protein
MVANARGRPPQLEAQFEHIADMAKKNRVWLELIEDELGLVIEFNFFGTGLATIYEVRDGPDEAEFVWDGWNRVFRHNSLGIDALVTGFAEAKRIIGLFQEGWRRGGGRPHRRAA